MESTKQRKPGRPLTISIPELSSTMSTLQVLSLILHYFQLHLLIVLQFLRTIYCVKAARSPVQLTPCNNLVCMSCLCKHLKESGSCNNDHLAEFTTITQPSSIVTTVLGRQKVTCSLCNNSTALGNTVV